MKSYHANSGAGIAGLYARQHDEPKPGPREALIRVRANSLNFRELMVLRGNYPLPVKPDVVMGADGAGEIVAVGPDVSRVKPSRPNAKSRTAVAASVASPRPQRASSSQ